jgi:hypothetical protein
VIRSPWTVALLLLVLFCSGGCTIVWHTTSPEISLRTADHQGADNVNVLAYRLTYRAPHLAEFVYKKGDVKFRKSIENAIERAGFHLASEDGARNVLDVQVWESQPRGAGLEWVTGLTLGAIPTWATEEGTYEFVLGLCDKDRELARQSYLVNTKTFNWILVLPVFWINAFLWNDTYNFLEQAVEVLLAEATEILIQADSHCLR